MKTTLTINPVSVIVGVGVIVGVYAIFKSVSAVGETFGDMTSWVTSLPTRVNEYAKEGGATWLDNTAPQPVNRQTTPDSYEPVYKDPLMNDDGMNFGLF